jgi:hypothetical protein
MTANPSRDDDRRIAGLFNREMMSSLLMTAESGLVPNCLTRAGFDGEGMLGVTCGQFFEKAYGRLLSRYRTQYVYKTAVVEKVVLGRHGLRAAALSGEFRVGRRVADLAVFTRTATAYEIKSELDSTGRLAGQLDAYARVFARTVVVTHEAQLRKVLAVASPEVGVTLLTGRYTLQVVREPVEDPGRVDPREIYSCLRKAERERALQVEFGGPPRFDPMYAYEEGRRMFATLRPERAHELLVEAYRARPLAKNLGPLLGEIPRSLRLLWLTQPLSGRERARLAEALRLTLGDLRRREESRREELRRLEALKPAPARDDDEDDSIPF